MLNSMSHRGALTATTAIAAVALIMIVPQARDIAINPQSRSESPVAAPEADLAEPLVEAPVIVEESAAPAQFKGAAPQSDVARRMAESGLRSRAIPDGASWARVDPELGIVPEADTEAFANAETNSLKVTSNEPVSTFSIDVDTASYAIVRSSLMHGQLPPKEAVRVEEMVNYFPYSYPSPEGDAAFRPTISVTPTPWNEGTQLVHIGIQGALPQIEDRTAVEPGFPDRHIRVHARQKQTTPAQTVLPPFAVRTQTGRSGFDRNLRWQRRTGVGADGGIRTEQDTWCARPAFGGGVDRRTSGVAAGLSGG